jgi:hypothetical protein
MVSLLHVGWWFLRARLRPATRDSRGTPRFHQTPGWSEARSLNIGSIGLGHYRRMVIVTMTTYGRWRPRELRSQANYITFEFDSRGGPGRDFYLYIDYRNGRLEALLAKNNGEFVAEASVGKRHPKSLGAYFPGRLLDPQDYIRTFGQTAFKGGGDCRRTCFDVAPDQGWVTHKW